MARKCADSEISKFTFRIPESCTNSFACRLSRKCQKSCKIVHTDKHNFQNTLLLWYFLSSKRNDMS